MKKIVALFLSVLIGAGVFAQQVSDPHVQEREAKNFHGISVSHAFDVWLTQGNEEKVAVSASEEKYLASIKVEVKDGILYIGWDHKSKWTKGNKKLKAYISFKNIDILKASGACDVDIVGVLKSDDLKMNFSGASDLEGEVDIKKLVFDLNGASDAKLKGTVVELRLDASGASKFRGFDLSVDHCNANASGASDIKIKINKELNADASGASHINYKGDGVIRDISTSGASRVSRS